MIEIRTMLTTDSIDKEINDGWNCYKEGQWKDVILTTHCV